MIDLFKPSDFGGLNEWADSDRNACCDFLNGMLAKKAKKLTCFFEDIKSEVMLWFYLKNRDGIGETKRKPRPEDARSALRDSYSLVFNTKTVSMPDDEGQMAFEFGDISSDSISGLIFDDFIKTLPDIQKYILIDTFVNQYDIKSIAQRYSISFDQVRGHKKKALIEIRNRLAIDGFKI